MSESSQLWHDHQWQWLPETFGTSGDIRWGAHLSAMYRCLFVCYWHGDACYDRENTFRVQWFLNDGAP